MERRTATPFKGRVVGGATGRAIGGAAVGVVDVLVGGSAFAKWVESRDLRTGISASVSPSSSTLLPMRSDRLCSTAGGSGPARNVLLSFFDCC